MITKKLVPQVRFEGFNGEWEEKILDEISSAIFDGTHQTPRYTDSGIPFFSVENLISKSKNKYISNEDYIEATKKNKPEKNDILITRIGNIGFSKVVTWDYDFSIYVTLAVIKQSKIFDSFYLNHYMQSAKYQAEIISKSLLSAVPCKINMNELRNTNIILPKNLTEQTKIGNYFQQLDKLIEQKEKKYQKLKQFKKAMLDKMFPKNGANIPEIRFKGFSGNWEEKRLDNIADIIGGGTPSTNITEYWNGDIDWYSPTEIGYSNFVNGSQKKITQLGLEKSSAKIHPANKTILFTSRAGIGDMAILNKEGSTNQGFQSLILKDDYIPYFIYSAGHLIKKYALTHASGSTFLEISGKQLGNMNIKVPSTEEQQKIGNYFQKLDKQIDLQQKEIEKLKNIKKASLDKMFV